MEQHPRSSLAPAIIDTADRNRTGIMEVQFRAKTTLRHLGKPTGATPALRNVISCKGVEVVL